MTQSRKASKYDRRGSDGRDHGRKAISDELVSVINDGLYFYEQVRKDVDALKLLVCFVDY
jgi:hypothetical protein